MHFCFDLDDVLSDTYSVLLSESLIFHCNVLNRPRVDRKVQDAYGDYFYFAKSLQWDEEELYRFFHEVYPMFLLKCKPRIEAVNVLNDLKRNNHRITILSARELRTETDVYDISLQWLNDAKIPFDKLIVGAKEKNDYLNMLKCDVFVDDSIKNCVNAIGVPSVFYFRCPYNEGANNPGVSSVIEIHSLYEILHILHIS